MDLSRINPYKVEAGEDLDAMIETLVMGLPSSGAPAQYSTSEKAARAVKARLQARYGFPIVTGATRIAGQPWYARQESCPSTSTEVLADTYPLAICRLAILLAARN